MKNILLTGANGFLGSHILKSLLAEGCSPIVLLRTSSDLWRIENELDKCKVFVLGDNGADLNELFNNFLIERIIHTAVSYGKGGSLIELIKTNVLLPIELIELGAQKNLKLFINTDSFFAKPQYQQTYLIDYITSKRVLEQILKNLSEKIKIVNLRLEHVYGEYDSDQKFVTAVFKQLMQNVANVSFTEGNQKRDFIYVADVVKAYLQILKMGLDSTGYNEFQVGTGKSITIKEFVQCIADTLNSTTELNFGVLPGRPGEIQNSYAQVTPLNEIGWQPSFTLVEALKNMQKKEMERFIL